MKSRVELEGLFDHVALDLIELYADHELMNRAEVEAALLLKLRPLFDLAGLD